MNELITLTLLALSLAQPAKPVKHAPPAKPVAVTITVPVSVTIQNGHDNMIFTVKASPQASPETP